MTLYKTDYSVVRETVQRIKESNEEVCLKLTTVIMLFPDQPFHVVRVNKCLPKKKKKSKDDMPLTYPSLSKARYSCSFQNEVTV